MTFEPDKLMFDSTNWRMAQTVTVTAVQDQIDEGARETRIIRNAFTGADYGSFPLGDIEVIVTDDDMRGVTVRPMLQRSGAALGA